MQARSSPTWSAGAGGADVTAKRSTAESIAAHATSTPDSPAIVEDAGRTLTYRLLDAHAHRLATRLRALGATREQVVALVLPRSADLVVSALATWKAGAAYAPFDPSTPATRLAEMLEDLQPAVVVAHSALASTLPAGGWPVFALGVDSTDGDAAFPPDMALSDVPADLAYVIYTSGSTGRPKGVEIGHTGLMNLLQWHTQTFTVTSSDRAAMLASPGFDASVWEIWPYLAAGASLYVADDDTRMDAAALRDWLVSREITLAFVATPMAERLLALPWPPHTRLRILLTGADTLHRRPPPGLPFQLVNNYGPTEATVVATSGVVPSDPLDNGLPSIGRPITNVQAYVLDEEGQPLTAGGEGELYLGGAGIARGYRNRPELTAQRFVASPLVPAGQWLYRTGDRARWLDDGSLAFGGRLDDQVKIRGHRIELDEIVATLTAHPGVEHAAVTAQPGPDGEPRLVAFVVAADGAALSPTALRATLGTRLPEYMLPATFVAVEALPLTFNGKVDRARLPAVDSVAPLRDAEFVAPRSDVETQLAELVSDLLGVHPIGLGDNFFMLGGHSLLGTQLIVRVREAFDVELSLRAVFDHPTLEDLARHVERALLTQRNAA
jgi:amino acid adenylation domain-containing protein